MPDLLPTGRLVRETHELIAEATDLAAFIESLELLGEVDPGSPPVHAMFKVLRDRLDALDVRARGLRDLAAFYVRQGLKGAA